MSAAHDSLVNEIMAYGSSIGALPVKVATSGLLFTRDGRPARIGKKGVLDVVLTLKGRAVWIDAKIGKDRLKKEQVKFSKAVTCAGGIAFAAWSVDDVAKRLKAEGLING